MTGYQEFDMFLRIVSSGGLIASLSYIISLERRLARMEGRIAMICKFPCVNRSEES